jgi:hypothetical protein
VTVDTLAAKHQIAVSDSRNHRKPASSPLIAVSDSRNHRKAANSALIAVSDSRSHRKAANSALVVEIVKQCLHEGKSVEIDGLGTFRPAAGRGFRFWPSRLPKVFLAYVEEDGAAVDRLYAVFEENGFAPWMDRRKLLPGQNWPRAIEEAIETADFFVPCFSRNSVSKKGGFQAEIRYALDCARSVPLDEVFIVPVRLNDCRVPARIQKELQYIDLFPRWESGLRRLFSMMRQAGRRRESPPGSGTLLPRDRRRA